MSLIAENISKRYFRKTGQANYFEAVKPVSFTLEEGTLTALMGRSGSGKTTLLHLLSGLLRPTQGKVILEGQDLYAMKDEALSRLRNQKMGVIPQARSAVDTLSVIENILLPSRLYGMDEPVKRAGEWMERLGIAHLADASPRELSGGELRRMAIARALSADPEVILADEPTGDLDAANTELALSALRDMAKAGKMVFVVTHEDDIRPYADRVWRMDAGSSAF